MQRFHAVKARCDYGEDFYFSVNHVLANSFVLTRNIFQSIAGLELGILTFCALKELQSLKTRYCS